MTRYAILIYGDEAEIGEVTPEEWTAMLEAHAAFAKAVADQGGTILGGEALAGAASATSVQADGSSAEGPFVSNRHTMGGFYLVEARDREHAVSLARLCPAPAGGVEVRPVVDISGGPGPAGG